MLTLLLVDAELERVPASIAGHPQVVQSARRTGVAPSKILLDSSLHYAALRDVPEGNRRGRPDLVHFFLLTALESIPNKQGHLRILVHTRNGELIRIRPETRLIRNYNRFCGLMAKLLEEGRVGEPDPLLELERKVTLSRILERESPDRIIVLDPEGSALGPAEIFTSDDAGKQVWTLIGGFPEGTYTSPMPKHSERISIHPAPLTVWTVAAELLAHYPRTGSTSAR